MWGFPLHTSAANHTRDAHSSAGVDVVAGKSEALRKACTSCTCARLQSLDRLQTCCSSAVQIKITLGEAEARLLQQAAGPTCDEPTTL